ncbi:hypothetical protein FEM48_Zijuj11G0143600 [Ziziphus jujuba var. spinosa]|uniref:Uncharacterized protein n=1 Tax=Ziziphus jujuba var. spinosa TaxID=714518 RepID=A0A978UJG1_ZIZJJ|nr:hypothetical protein FEM48_Zijuj11G0143600 [Ziziphus jujuba var. spinosa]
MKSDDRLHGYNQTPLTGDRLYISQCETDHDHVFIRNMHIDFKDVFGEEWSSVCSNVTEASFRVSIKGAVDWEIKKFGLELVNYVGLSLADGIVLPRSWNPTVSRQLELTVAADPVPSSDDGTELPS